MANRRCITLDIVDTDEFLDLPVSAQALYFHICVRADDDGFCDNAHKICKFTNTSFDDLSLLLKKKFLLQGNKGIVIVKHWWMHNTKRKDTYKQSPHLKDNLEICVDENNAYTFDKSKKRYRTVTEPLPQININKTKLNKDNVNKDKLINRCIESHSIVHTDTHDDDDQPF